MPRARKLAALAGTTTLALAATAIVASATGISDPRGDVKGNPAGAASKHDVDIVKATAGTVGNKVKLTVKVDGSVKVAIKRIETSPGFLLAKKGDKDTSFDVFGTDPPGYQAESFRNGQSVPVKVGTPNKHKATFVFNPKPLALPANYKWQAVTGLCKPLDAAPNNGFAKAGKRC
jgi:hypothetical protein